MATVTTAITITNPPAMSTPSPTTSTMTSASSSSARKSARKSTLTQQQKNQKRQRATQEQLITLELEFKKNPTPTAQVRDRIAQEINMTERSVQIWFQNRRAKIKNIAKKSIESGEDCNDIPESMRRYLAMQAMESGNPLGREFIARPANGVTFANGVSLHPESNSKIVIQHFTCRSLTIGSWRRVGQSTMDLIIFYSPDKACITYYINNGSAGYKIEYPFSYIKNISLEAGDPVSNAEGASLSLGGLLVELNRPPNFFMDDSGSGGFFQCGDFTEDQQASQILVHHLGGHPKALSGQLAKLVSLEAFQKRHTTFDPSILVGSAPMSPLNVSRPSSQPNHMFHPHLSFYPDSPYVRNSLHPPRGHKRQRSRSVPPAMNLAAMRHPMPSYLMPPEHPVTMGHPDIYAPVPQHHNPHHNPPGLSIDTSAAYNYDLHQYPVSATTVNSPSEHGTPAYYTSSAHSDTPLSVSAYPPPYGLPYLSPVPDQSMVHHSDSAISALSHGDPVIADQSPPLPGLDHGTAGDMYHMSHERGSGPDEALALGEIYGKSLSLPFRASVEEHAITEDVNVNGVTGYGTIDPVSLRQEDQSMWAEEKLSS